MFDRCIFWGSLLTILVIGSCGKPPVVTPPTQNIIKSSCDGTTMNTDYFKEDAQVLAVRYINTILSDKGITIPQDVYEEIIAALLAVYNSTDLPERDSIINLYGIHAKHTEVIHEMVMEVDASLSWVDEWRQGNQATNEPDIDQLFSDFDLQVQVLNDTPTKMTVLITSTSSLNFQNLASSFIQINGVENAAVKEAENDGNDIFYYKESIFRELIFSVGYQDCMNICQKRRFWRFLIYIDCSVEFLESYGDLAP